MPRGNPNGNPGNKGGGRKGAYVELKNAERLQAIWTTPGILEQIKKRIKNKTATMEDVFIAKGFLEDVRPMIEIFKKLFPDTLDITSKGDKIIPILGGLSTDDSDTEDIEAQKAD